MPRVILPRDIEGLRAVGFRPWFVNRDFGHVAMWLEEWRNSEKGKSVRAGLARKFGDRALRRMAVGQTSR
jgi:hypothetical protein